MSNVEKLSIALTPEMAAMVRGVVTAGEYASTSEVVREALREWRARRSAQLQNIDEIRVLWKEGVESGPGQHGAMEKILHAARKRKKSPKKSSKPS